jgi:tyrosinase
MVVTVWLRVMQLLLLTAPFFHTSNCSPISTIPGSHILEELALEKRQSSFFSVLGVAGLSNSTIHPRLEIRELEKNADQWNVYLLGLRRFQAVAQSDKLSYYQVAGTYMGLLLCRTLL